jgi:hypothetical protein
VQCGRFRSAALAWLAVFAILLQVGAGPFHRWEAKAADADALSALGALTAAFGPHVALCLNEDGPGPGTPAHDSHDCCDDCALCQQSGHSAALVPAGHAVPTRTMRALAGPLAPADADAPTPRRAASAQPRAPPHFA